MVTMAFVTIFHSVIRHLADMTDTKKLTGVIEVIRYRDVALGTFGDIATITTHDTRIVSFFVHDDTDRFIEIDHLLDALQGEFSKHRRRLFGHIDEK